MSQNLVKRERDLNDDVNEFVGRRQQDRKEPLVKQVDEVAQRLQQKRNQAEARKKQKKEEKEKQPERKFTTDEMNDFVLRNLVIEGDNGLTLRDVKKMTKQSDTLIRNALKQFGTIIKTFPTHVYVLKDEYKVRKREEVKEEEKEEFEFESEEVVM